MTSGGRSRADLERAQATESRDVAIVGIVVGAAFGAVAGGVSEGGRNPERAGELRTADDEPDPSTAVESNPSS